MADRANDSSIDYFNKGHFLTGIQIYFSLRARRKIFNLSVNYFGLEKSDRIKILDIGTTPDEDREDSNCIIKWFYNLGHEISLYSPENLNPLLRILENAKVLNFSDSQIPATDSFYDFSISSATLEHVGERNKQVAFIKECARVSKTACLTTPNGGHWLEFHTKLPFLHWFPRSIHAAILKVIGMSYWADPNVLRLLDKRELLELAEEALSKDRKYEYELKQIWSLGMPSNQVLLIKRVLE